jgi:hypothetical protein
MSFEYDEYMYNLENEIEANLLFEEELFNKNSIKIDEIQKVKQFDELKESLTTSNDNFSFGKFINSGSFGVVIKGIHNSNEDEILAFKFFGYTRNKPIMEWINKEIVILLKLYNCKHVAQIKYIFQDTFTGLIPYGKLNVNK